MRRPPSSPTPLVLGDRGGDTIDCGGGGGAKEKICRPPCTWEVPTTQQQSINRHHPIYIFCCWSLCGRVRLVVGRQTRPLYFSCPRTWLMLPCEKYFPYPLYGAAAAPCPFHPLSQYHLKLCVWWSYFNFIDMKINDSIWSNLLINTTELLIFFITNYTIRKNIWQVINYNLIKTIKKSLFINSKLIKTIKKNEHLSRYQL